ncbi:hypothetical protein CHUAL_004010 [Chamberlinius hualienensis]
MAAYFGLHVGSTSISVAVCKDKQAEVIANDAGDRVIPAFISDNEGELAVGVYSSRNATNVITCCIRLLGINEVDNDEVRLIQKRCPCKIVKILNKDELGYELTNGDGKAIETVPVKKALQLVFQQLMDTALRHAGIGGENYAVLSVPVGFSENQKQLIKDVATLSGFKVLQVISEPSSALLAYQIDCKEMENSNKIAVVYRAGGSSVDVTVCAIKNGHFRHLTSVTRAHLGGEDVTDAIVQHLCQDILRLHKVDVSNKSRPLYKLRHAAEECKRVLSTIETTACSVESLYEGIDFVGNFSRARLESLLGVFIPKFIEPIDEALRNSKITSQKVDMLILCGGTCKIPKLQQVLTTYFQSSCEVLLRQSPDEILAIGAAIQAENLKGMEDFGNLDEDFTIQTVGNALSYKILTGGESKLIFEAGTAVPSKVVQQIELKEGEDSLLLFETDVSGKETDIAKISLDELRDNTIFIKFNIKLNNTLELELTSGQYSRNFTIF